MQKKWLWSEEVWREWLRESNGVHPCTDCLGFDPSSDPVETCESCFLWKTVVGECLQRVKKGDRECFFFSDNSSDPCPALEIVPPEDDALWCPVGAMLAEKISQLTKTL